MCTLDNRRYVQKNLSLEYRLYLATLLSYARFQVYIYRLGIKQVNDLPALRNSYENYLYYHQMWDIFPRIDSLAVAVWKEGAGAVEKALNIMYYIIKEKSKEKRLGLNVNNGKSRRKKFRQAVNSKYLSEKLKNLLDIHFCNFMDFFPIIFYVRPSFPTILSRVKRCRELHCCSL